MLQSSFRLRAIYSVNWLFTRHNIIEKQKRINGVNVSDEMLRQYFGGGGFFPFCLLSRHFDRWHLVALVDQCTTAYADDTQHHWWLTAEANTTGRTSWFQPIPVFQYPLLVRCIAASVHFFGIQRKLHLALAVYCIDDFVQTISHRWSYTVSANTSPTVFLKWQKNQPIKQPTLSNLTNQISAVDRTIDQPMTGLSNR